MCVLLICFLIRCKGTENKWYIQVFYTFMKDFFSFCYTFMNDFCWEYYIFMNDFLSYNKMQGEILKTIEDNYWQLFFETKIRHLSGYKNK